MLKRQYKICYSFKDTQIRLKSIRTSSEVWPRPPWTNEEEQEDNSKKRKGMRRPEARGLVEAVSLLAWQQGRKFKGAAEISGKAIWRHGQRPQTWPKLELYPASSRETLEDQSRDLRRVVTMATGIQSFLSGQGRLMAKCQDKHDWGYQGTYWDDTFPCLTLHSHKPSMCLKHRRFSMKMKLNE